ncbi:MAG: hypothetical protein IKK47_02680 [Ruminococcus sp.]|nr:hypothetical protein [Ruminococcus sp.]
MKLTYRDKVILAVVLAVAICVGGFFGLIKPKRQQIKDNQANLETLENEKTEIERKIKRIKKVEDNINTTWDDSKKNTAVFVDEELIKQPKLLDEYMYNYAEKADVRVMELKVDELATSAINYYYKPYVEVATALRENADINGTMIQKVAEDSADSMYISSRNVENIMSVRYGLTVEGALENVWDYLKEIEKVNEAVIVTSVSMSEVEDEEKEDDKAATPAGGQNQNAQQQQEEEDSDQPQNWEKDTIVEANIVIQLYSVYEMEEPDTKMKKD